MTPFTPEPTEILVADERLSPWSSAGVLVRVGASDAPLDDTNN